MRDSTSGILHQPILDRVLDYPLFDPDAELFPEITALTQSFQVTAVRFLSITTDVNTTEFAPLEKLCLWTGSPTGF